MIIIGIGIGLLAASLLANSFGGDPGFRPQQTAGTITGVVIAGVGLFFWRKAKDPPSDQPD